MTRSTTVPAGAAAPGGPTGRGVAARRRPPRRASFAAAGFSLLYGLAGVWWAAGGAGYPFADPETALSGSLLGTPAPEVAGTLIAVLGLTGAICALAMTAPWGRSSRPVLLGFGWTAAAALTLVVPDSSLLSFLGYLPLLSTTYGFSTVAPAEVNQLVCVAGGLVWAAATLAFQRHHRDACARCGRRDGAVDDAAGGQRPMPWWGVWATWVAVAAPLPYAATRAAWALGVPVGVPTPFLASDGSARLSALGLAAAAVAGAVLTMGLVQRWGEVFPRWMVGLAGRRVPVSLAVVPATVAAIALLAGSRMLIGASDLLLRFEADTWGPGLPLLALPVWGVALAVATFAYARRRRGRCGHCGRG